MLNQDVGLVWRFQTVVIGVSATYDLYILKISYNSYII